jgi:hypothetical protein
MAPTWGTYVEVEPTFSCGILEAAMLGELVLKALTHFKDDGKEEEEEQRTARILSIVGIDSWQVFAHESSICLFFKRPDHHLVLEISGDGHAKIAADSQPEAIGRSIINVLQRKEHAK